MQKYKHLPINLKCDNRLGFHRNNTSLYRKIIHKSVYLKAINYAKNFPIAYFIT